MHQVAELVVQYGLHILWVGMKGALMPKERSISARGAPCNGQDLAQQQAGLFHDHLANQFLSNKVSLVETQQVAMFAKGSGASGVDDFAQVGSHGTNRKFCL